MMDNLSISRKLWVAFAGVIAVTVLSAAFILYDSLLVVQGLEESARRSAKVTRVENWHRAASQTHSSLLSYINSGDIKYAEVVENGFANTEAAERALGDMLNAGTALSNDAAQLSALMDEWRSEVAEPQLREMTDPLTFDMARLRELSPLNQRLWSEINDEFELISQDFQRGFE